MVIDNANTIIKEIEKQPKETIKSLTSSEKTKTPEDIVSELYSKNIKEDMKVKKEYATKLLNCMIFQFSILYLFVGIKLFFQKNISDNLLIAFMGGTFGETIIIIRFIVKYLFNNDLDKHFDTILKKSNNYKK